MARTIGGYRKLGGVSCFFVWEALVVFAAPRRQTQRDRGVRWINEEDAVEETRKGESVRVSNYGCRLVAER